MNITQDVITDLLPVYFSGEASSETRALVDSFFREHPDFEKLARRSVKVQLPVESEATDGEMEVFRRVRRKIRRHGTLLGGAITLTLLPLTTAVSTDDHGHSHLLWFMPRDYPIGAAILFAAAAVLWTLYFRKRGLKQEVKRGDR
jgi:hypothetical protein